MDFEMKRWGEIPNVGHGFAGFYKEKFYAVLFTQAGSFRGNHVHPNKQSSILLSGKAKYVQKIGDKLISTSLEIGKLVEVDAGVPHILLAEEDTLTVEWWEGEFKIEPYKIVEVEGGRYLKVP